MADVFIISCGSLLFIEGWPYLMPCKWQVLPFSGYVQWKCVPAAKIFTLGPNHPRSSLLTCKECCHNRAGAAVHRIQLVMPRCPLCPQTCVQYQYTLPYTFYLCVFVSCSPLSGRGCSVYNGPAHVYRYIMRFCSWLSSFQIGLMTETKAIYNPRHERPKQAMTTFACTLILWMWVFQLGHVGMSIFSRGSGRPLEMWDMRSSESFKSRLSCQT